MKQNAALILEDGTIAIGEGFGAEGEAKGELVFNTSMTGYQEALTDPSYKYQILMLTYPLIGNYGIHKDAFESSSIQVEGFVVREISKEACHSKMFQTLEEFLKSYEIPGICNVDTRYLTRKIRVHGVMNCILAYPFSKEELPELKARAKELKSISELDLVRKVTIKEPRIYKPKTKKIAARIALIDCGVKESIIRALLARQLEVIRVPATFTAKEILSYEPLGVVVSNGPGDPKKADYVIKTVKSLIDEQVPLFGICLGNQILALALGSDTYKLKFGHRGANQPVKDLIRGKVYITSQNHGFAVDPESLDGTGLEVSHINLNDNSVEGLVFKEGKAFSVQYHPEASPGPHDSYHLFDEFIKAIKDESC